MAQVIENKGSKPEPRGREAVASNETFGRADALLLGAMWTQGTASFEDRCFRGHEVSEPCRA